MAVLRNELFSDSLEELFGPLEGIIQNVCAQRHRYFNSCKTLMSKENPTAMDNDIYFALSQALSN